MLPANKNRVSLPASMWVVSLYFIEGLPFSLVNTVSVALFKTLQIGNSEIGLFTSLFYLPWAIKFLWAPLIDYTGQRRKWIIGMQTILASFVMVLSFCILFAQSFFVLCILFMLIAFTSATYDIACDGYYLDALDKAKQSLYIGWRNTAYKLAWLFAAGFLVYLSGKISDGNYLEYLKPVGSHWLDIQQHIVLIYVGWSIVFFLAALIFAAGAILHAFILPLETDRPKEQKRKLLLSFAESFKSFFQQTKIWLILSWILFFRAGDAMLLKMAQPFLLDAHDKGGLGLSLETVGFIYGSLGITALLAGGIIGGWLVFKYGLKRCLLPTAVLQSVTLLLYWLLAIFKPILPYIAIANAFEQLVYGLATAAYTSYLFTIVKDKFLASHYAIATGFMAVGMILPGAISGYLVDYFGYQKFFLISFFSSLPGIFFTIKLLTINKQ